MDRPQRLTPGQAARAFRYKWRNTGPRSALRASLGSIHRLGRPDAGQQAPGAGVDAAVESFLPGAPRGWSVGVAQMARVSQAQAPGAIGDADARRLLHRVQALAAASTNRPDLAVATIVIPVFDNLGECLVLLESLFSWSSRVNFRVVVTDDASPRADYAVLSGLPGVTVIRRPQNGGYVANVNAAVEGTDTEYVVTLNQDSVVGPGWLDGLVAEFAADPQVAIAGSIVVGNDLRIKEAGGAVFSDGSAAHRGRGAPLSDPAYAFSADVDYVSGCAMMVRRSAWTELDGLAEEFSPAYYDDTDLCLRAWAAGWRVRLASRSVVVHHEGTSMGTSEADEGSLKRFQVQHREVFRARHAHALCDHADPGTRATHRRRSERQLVVVAFDVPQTDRDGGSIDTAAFVDVALTEGWQVTCLVCRDVSPAESASWRHRGVRTQEFGDRVWSELLATDPTVVSFGLEPGILVSRQDRGRARWIHFTSDVASRRLQMLNELLVEGASVSDETRTWYAGQPRDHEAMWRVEKEVLDAADVLVFVTAEDREYAAARGVSGDMRLFPILRGAPQMCVPGAPMPSPVVSFVGSMGHTPNIDAVDWFTQEVWPLISTRLPDAQFHVWGSGVTPSMNARWQKVPGVHVRGWFRDWDQVTAETRLLAAPLRIGAGMKGKVVTALLDGLPVIGTTLAFEGLPLGDGAALVESDTPDGLADRIVGVLESDAHWRAAIAAGQDAIAGMFTPEAERDRVVALLEGAEGCRGE